MQLHKSNTSVDQNKNVLKNHKITSPEILPIGYFLTAFFRFWKLKFETARSVTRSDKSCGIWVKRSSCWTSICCWSMQMKNNYRIKIIPSQFNVTFYKTVWPSLQAASNCLHLCISNQIRTSQTTNIFCLLSCLLSTTDVYKSWDLFSKNKPNIVALIAADSEGI